MGHSKYIPLVAEKYFFANQTELQQMSGVDSFPFSSSAELAQARRFVRVCQPVTHNPIRT
jgi:hypothetical protein